EEERPAAAAAQRRCDVLAPEDEPRGARRGDDDVGTAERLADPVERQRGGPEPLRERCRAIGGPVGDDRDPRAAREQVPRGELADLARAEQDDRPAVEVAEDLLRERGGGGRDRGRALAAPGLGACLAAGVQRLAEEPGGKRPRRADVER